MSRKKGASVCQYMFYVNMDKIGERIHKICYEITLHNSFFKEHQIGSAYTLIHVHHASPITNLGMAIVLGETKLTTESK